MGFKLAQQFGNRIKPFVTFFGINFKPKMFEKIKFRSSTNWNIFCDHHLVSRLDIWISLRRWYPTTSQLWTNWPRGTNPETDILKLWKLWRISLLKTLFRISGSKVFTEDLVSRHRWYIIVISKNNFNTFLLWFWKVLTLRKWLKMILLRQDLTHKSVSKTTGLW